MKYQHVFTTIDTEFSKELTERKELKIKLTFTQKKYQKALNHDLHFIKITSWDDDGFQYLL